MIPLPSRPTTIAITGGIGTGKTTVARYIEKKYNASTFYADDEAKALLHNSEQIREKVIEAFGSYILNKGVIDNQKLADKVFNSSCNQKKINNIMWPVINRMVLDSIAKATDRNKDFFILDAALVIESGISSRFNHLLLVKASLKDRIIRVSKRSRLSKIDIRNRINLQMDETKKENYASTLIDNKSDLDNLYKQVDSFMLSL